MGAAPIGSQPLLPAAAGSRSLGGAQVCRSRWCCIRSSPFSTSLVRSRRLAMCPGDDVVFVASTPGPVTDHTGRSALVASASLDDVPSPDVVVVPGGFGDTELDAAVVRWLRKVHARRPGRRASARGRSTLRRPGSFDGVDATTHWARKDRSSIGCPLRARAGGRAGQGDHGSGVSSGIDMALASRRALARAPRWPSWCSSGSNTTRSHRSMPVRRRRRRPRSWSSLVARLADTLSDDAL